MGCPLVQAPSKLGKLGAKKVTAYGSVAAENDSEYASSRYVCLMKTVIESATQGTLSVDEYPSVMPLPDAEAMLAPSSLSRAKSVRKTSATSKWASTSTGSDKGGKKKGFGGRQIIFMTGGMCYSEMRSAREVMTSSGMEVVVGSNRFINPTEFMVDLKNLSKGES